MGEIADMMIEGFIDAETGELLDGEAPGYPRSKYGNIPGAQKPNQKTGFQCDMCGKYMRTEQGLCDHIRDKHQGFCRESFDALREELKECGKDLVVILGNIQCELAKGHDEWLGVDTHLRKRIDKVSAVLAKAEGKQ